MAARTGVSIVPSAPSSLALLRDGMIAESILAPWNVLRRPLKPGEAAAGVVCSVESGISLRSDRAPDRD